jgi:hypothetical protein
MAKGQMRSNREQKKPKASKPSATAEVQSVSLKGSTEPMKPKKKG